MCWLCDHITDLFACLTGLDLLSSWTHSIVMCVTHLLQWHTRLSWNTEVKGLLFSNGEKWHQKAPSYLRHLACQLITLRKEHFDSLQDSRTIWLVTTLTSLGYLTLLLSCSHTNSPTSPFTLCSCVKLDLCGKKGQNGEISLVDNKMAKL